METDDDFDSYSRREQKVLHILFKSAWASALAQDMLQWSGKLQDSNPSNFAFTGPDCSRLFKQLPQGDQSNLVYSPLSIHSSNLAQVIITLSPPKSLPEVLPQKAACGSGVSLLSVDQYKHHISLPMHFLNRLLLTFQVSATQCSPLTQNTSVTLTHICRIARTHSITATNAFSLRMSRPTWTGQTMPLICSPASAWATVHPAHQGQALHGGVIH